MAINTIALFAAIRYNNNSNDNYIFKSYAGTLQETAEESPDRHGAAMPVVIVRGLISRGRKNEVLTAVKLTPVVETNLKVPQKQFVPATERCKGKPHKPETQITVEEPCKGNLNLRRACSRNAR